MSLIHHVPLNHVKKVCNRVLARMGENAADIVIARICKKEVENYGQRSIDSAFVLRVLLEYYRVEKQQNLETFKALFIKALEIKYDSTGIKFPLLREIVTYYFPKMPEYEVSILYRESWCLGGGKVQLENFFTVLSERGHLVRILNLPLPNEMPRFLSDIKKFQIIGKESENTHDVACRDAVLAF